jgi:hypothetical protein
MALEKQHVKWQLQRCYFKLQLKGWEKQAACVRRSRSDLWAATSLDLAHVKTHRWNKAFIKYNPIYVRCMILKHVIPQAVIYPASHRRTLRMQSEVCGICAQAKAYLQHPLLLFTVPNHLLLHKLEPLTLRTHSDLEIFSRHLNVCFKTSFWYVATCSLIATHTLFKRNLLATSSVKLHPESLCSRLLWNYDTYLPDCTNSNTRRRYCLYVHRNAYLKCH